MEGNNGIERVVLTGQQSGKALLFGSLLYFIYASDNFLGKGFVIFLNSKLCQGQSVFQ